MSNFNDILYWCLSILEISFAAAAVALTFEPDWGGATTFALLAIYAAIKRYEL
jgi:hypothetical protein